ncbi:hypothetical protein PAECIP111893_04418 [Paenibacillus plantiphilus]|uniref:Uncharacterized protein n=1 Tax=Paenibacillus plantiphilus TaxID=2905650 RepID=A0ABN8GX57_9BACL|nr:hypothetical protein [Paenibacillus plantiphilus]CAH1218367.1 hypothetical protein PAECIP111893_04418 [Paenibacillus plantiphilus]
MMFKNEKFMLLLMAVFVILCVGIASAQGSEQSLEELTGKSVQDVQKDPEESAKSMVSNYFSAIMQQEGKGGAALTDFKITNVDSSDLSDIKVTVNLKYENIPELPAANYHVIRIDNTYQVKKQFCAYDLIPNSRTHGTVNCSSSGNEGSDNFTIAN